MQQPCAKAARTSPVYLVRVPVPVLCIFQSSTLRTPTPKTRSESSTPEKIPGPRFATSRSLAWCLTFESWDRKPCQRPTNCLGLPDESAIVELRLAGLGTAQQSPSFSTVADEVQMHRRRMR